MSGVAGIIEGFRARSGDRSLLDHLDDLRGRLIGALVVLALATGLGFYLSVTFDVLGVFVAPIEPFLNGGKLKYLSPTDPFFITLKLAFCIGFVLALPYLLAQAWALIGPLMRKEEKRFVGPMVAGGTVLFAAGSIFCYLFVIPLMLSFVMGFQTGSLEQYIVIGEYLKLVLRMLIAFGFAFQLPVVILFLTVLGLITPEFLVSKRRHAIACVTVVSAMVTPPDLASLVLLAVPVCLLYEVSIVLSRAVLARRTSGVAISEV